MKPVFKVILMDVAYLATFIFVLFLIAGEADIPYIIGTIILSALAELLRKVFGYDTLVPYGMYGVSPAYSDATRISLISFSVRGT